MATPGNQAVRIHQFGPSGVLHPEIIERPEPGAGEMLVRVEAASVNPVDLKMRSGKYPPTKADSLPLILGRDLAGVIEKLGNDVADFSPGDEIYGLLDRDRGAYARYVVVKPEEAAHKPANLGFVEAAAVPLAGLTAWQGLYDQGGLKAGQRVLIHGGAGGVGHLAIQFAKISGATVITTASDKDRQFLAGLGADLVIDHKTQAFDELLADDPVDLVFDVVGGDTRDRSFAIIKKGGMLVSTLGKPDASKGADQNIRIAGYMTTANRGQLEQITRLIEAGEVVPHIADTLPLTEAAKAHDELENQHIQGKIVLRAA